MAIYQSTHDSNQFAVKQIKWVNYEAQFLRIFCSLYFETKCNNHKRDSFDFFCQHPFLPLKVCIIILIGITKPCTHLHPAPFTSTQLYPALSTSTQLHSPPSSSFQSPTSSLHHPQRYLNQNIARNWAISPNLSQKIKSCQFWLKIGTHGILDVLIPNPDLDFRNLDPKIYFWENLDPKIQSCPFCLKNGVHSISKILIPNPEIDFLKFRPENPFLGKFGPKNSKFSVLFKTWYTWYLKDADSCSNINFMNFQL